MSTATANRMLEAALEYAALGYPVFRIRPNDKKPLKDTNGLLDATTDEPTIMAWWTDQPRCNVAVETSGLLVVDIDGTDNPWLTEPEKLLDLAAAPFSQTPTGGRHYFFRQPPGEWRNTQSELAPKVDTRADGGYVVVAPSVRPEGQYQWLDGSLDVPRDKLPLPPQWVADGLSAAKQKKRTKSNGSAGEWTEGSRNATLASLAGAMRRRGATMEEISAELHLQNRTRCKPPLDHWEVETIVVSVSSYDPHKHETDLGNARRLIEHFGDKIRYVGSWRKWLAWDGARWRLDDTGAVDRFAQETVRRIFDEARDEKDDARRNCLARHAIASQSRGKLDAMVAIASTQPEVAITHDALNTHPHLLNCTNGTVDLRTGELQPHKTTDLLTQTTGIEYPTEIVAPELWLDTLGTIFDADASMVGFVQRLFGLGLLGEVVEHLLGILHGDGANGKSVVVETAMGVMGDYAIKAPRDFCIASKHEQHPTQIADLYGKRLVVITETGDGQRLDEALVKELTGGDTLRARRMREDHWEFTPSHLALMVTNHRPTVRGVDNGIWRRLKLVPFNVVIPEADQDPELPRKLKADWPLILRWMVQGYLDYRRGGLQPPEAVQLATSEYRGSMDSFMQFIDERCTLAEGQLVKSSPLLHAYRAWCEDQGLRAISGQMFGKRIKRLPGVDSYRSNGIVYQGVGLDGT